MYFRLAYFSVYLSFYIIPITVQVHMPFVSGYFHSMYSKSMFSCCDSHKNILMKYFFLSKKEIHTQYQKI
jgi:hypothetical protein